jgi:hypothetical protein
VPEEYQDRPTQVAGYRELSDKEVEVVNFTKSMEEQLAGWWLKVGDLVPDLDRRWMAVARTHFQEGFSAIVRAVTRPRDPFERS